MRLRNTIAAAGVLAAGAVSQAQPLAYNPTLGTLPQDQGWTNDSTFAATSSVSGGQLTYGPTSFNGVTAWSHSPTQALDFSTGTAFIEAEVRLTGTGFGNVSGFRRGGFSLYLQDAVGRYIIADLGDNNISLGNDNERLSDPVAAFDLTSSFHVVRLEAGPAGARLFVDGLLQLSDSLGAGASASSLATWGDMTILSSSSQTEIRSVLFVPSPAAGLPLAALTLLGRRRQGR